MEQVTKKNWGGECRTYVFLDAQAYLDFKLSVSKWVIDVFGLPVNQVKQVMQVIQLIQVMQVMQGMQVMQVNKTINDNHR